MKPAIFLPQQRSLEIHQGEIAQLGHDPQSRGSPWLLSYFQVVCYGIWLSRASVGGNFRKSAAAENGEEIGFNYLKYNQL